MEILKLNENNVCETIENIIKNQEEKIVYGIPSNFGVFSGNNSLNFNFCKRNNINIMKFPNEGGVIVVGKDDFDIGFFSKNLDYKFNEKLAIDILEFLKSKGLNAELYGNDFVIDKMFKCGSFSSRKYGNLLYSAFHISINVNLPLIESVCIKPMTKIPKGLKDFGIKTEEIKNIFMNFLNKENLI